ncbi:MAG: twin-arginine translocase subunit TatC [Dehalococcoidia bacterium]
MAVQPPVKPAPTEPEPQPARDEEAARVLTILEHLRELRYRLMVSVGALIVAMIVSFYPLTGWFIEFLKQPAVDRDPDFKTVFFDPLEGWTTYFSVSLLLGVAIAMPVIVYQILAFIAPGLTKDERRWLYPITIGASLAFLSGCAFAYYVQLGPFLGFLLNPPGDIGEPFISIKKYIGFVTRLMFVMGLVFELPLIVMGLAKIGIVTAGKLIAWWRYAFILSFVAAAVVTPTVDPVNQSIVAGPIIVLYCIGIGLAKLVQGSPLIPRSP